MSAMSPHPGEAAAIAGLTELLLPVAKAADRTWRGRRAPSVSNVRALSKRDSRPPRAPAIATMTFSGRIFATTYIAAKPRPERFQVKKAVVTIENAYLALKRRRAKVHSWVLIHEDLCNSEMAYVASLSTLLDQYAAPMRRKDVLTAEQQSVLFCNIRLIRDFHEGFSQRLAACCSSVALANCFCDFIAFLPHYGVYIDNYANALKVLTFARKDSSFKRFSRSISLPESNAVFPDINCFLIMPLQKLARYQLFLSRLQKVLPRGSNALAQVTAVLELLRKRTQYFDCGGSSSPRSQAQEEVPKPYRALPSFLRPVRTAVQRCKGFVLQGAGSPVCVQAM